MKDFQDINKIFGKLFLCYLHGVFGMMVIISMLKAWTWLYMITSICQMLALYTLVSKIEEPKEK